MSKHFYINDWCIQPELNKISLYKEEWKVEPKIMAVLVVLIENKGEVVSKDFLLETVWENSVVVDMVVTRSISELRRIFNDTSTNSKIIETISKKGYRLIADVSDQAKNSVRNKKRIRNLGNFYKLFIFSVIIICVFFLLTDDSDMEKEGETKYRIKPFTTLTGLEYQPTISWDNKTVAFIRKIEEHYEIHTKTFTRDQSKVLVSSKNSYGCPVWSPDNKQLAYYKNTNGRVTINTISIYEGIEKELLQVKTISPGLAWSPNGEQLAYLTNDSENNQLTIYLYSFSSNKSTQLTKPIKNSFGDWNPRFSPDGKYVGFIRTINEGNEDIYRIDIANGKESKLTSLNSNIFGFDWKTDKTYVFSSNFDGTTMLWRNNVGRKETPKLIPIGIDYQNPEIRGNHLLLEKWTKNIDVWGGRIVNDSILDRSPWLESTQWDLHPDFSMDGKQIVFVSNRSGGYEIWAQNLSDHSSKKLTTMGTSLNRNPKWSPNNNLIAFDSKNKGKSSIYLKNINDESIIEFTKGQGNDIAPYWSNSSNWIYFSSDRSGIWQVWKKRIYEEQKPIQITSNGGYYAQESLDGKSIYYCKFKKNGLWKMELSTKKEELIIDSLISSDYGNYKITKSGIYYVKRGLKTINTSKIMYYNFKSKIHRSIIETSKPIPTFDSAISISEDEKWIVYGQMNNYNGDLISVEGF